jgi:hypothetical protein
MSSEEEDDFGDFEEAASTVEEPAILKEKEELELEEVGLFEK